MDINNIMQQMMMNAMKGAQPNTSSGHKKNRFFNAKNIVLLCIVLISLFFNFKQSKEIKKLKSSNIMETTTIHPYNRCLKIVMKSMTSDQISKVKPDDIIKVCERLKSESQG